MTHSAAAVISAGICAAVGPVGVSRTLTAEVTHVRDILSGITKWWEAGESFGLATVVRTYRSAPRDPGAALAVSAVGNHGAIDFAAAVARAGKFLGYHVTVCDARKVFATASRFPTRTRWWSTGRTGSWPAPRWTPGP